MNSAYANMESVRMSERDVLDTLSRVSVDDMWTDSAVFTVS